VKLRLDEMVPRAVAGKLRKRGHDVDTVVEHSELRGLSDEEQFARAQRDARAFVTYDAGDYLRIAQRWTGTGRRHAGLIILESRGRPQGEVDVIVRRLATFLSGSSPPDDFVRRLG
jgi:hypothetical protein